MKKVFVSIFILFSMFGCKERIPSEIELYGNTFINIRSGKFDVPADWVRYSLMDSACSIMMPPNMKETPLDGINVINKKRGTNFAFRDTTNSQKHYYSRVAIDYFKVNQGTFAKPDEYVLNSEFDKNNKLIRTHFLDTYYRRKSVTGDSPVSVHIYIMQNDDKMVKMMGAYHDKDSLIFKDLFQSVKNFEWN